MFVDILVEVDPRSALVAVETAQYVTRVAEKLRTALVQIEVPTVCRIHRNRRKHLQLVQNNTVLKRLRLQQKEREVPLGLSRVINLHIAHDAVIYISSS